MNTKQQPSALHKALDELETCLATPVIPGELPQWCRAAKTACDEVKEHWSREVEEVHPKLFKQIFSEDPALAARVDALREQDQKLTEQTGRVQARLERLEPAAGAVEPDEQHIEKYVQSAVDAGLELVIELRKQETAITTWYMEALERDRGVVD